jgi:enoyl-CoA hydratase/carnithine racemase
MTTHGTVLLELEKGEQGMLAILTLNRPEVRNAINLQMVQDLGMVLDEIATNDDVRAIVITGAGDKAFASGADIAQLKERGVADALRRINAAIFRRLEEQPIPAIAAIKGYCLGGGCELAMACDLRIAGETAKLGQPEVSLGIMPGAGAVQRLPKLVGLGLAKELIFTGRILDAKEAERIGLVNRVVKDEEVLREAKAIGQQIASQGALAVKISKLALNASARSNSAFDTLDALGQAVLFESEDKHRRMSEFLDRRSGSARKTPGS